MTQPPTSGPDDPSGHPHPTGTPGESWPPQQGGASPWDTPSGQPTWTQHPAGQQPSYDQGWGQNPSQQTPHQQTPGQQQGWTQQEWAQQSPYQPYGPPPGANPARKGSGMSIAALVLGIVGFIAAFFPIGSYAAIVIAILALIFGIIGVRRRSGKGMAVSGIVLGGVALIIAIIASIIWTNVFRVYFDCVDQYPDARGPAFDQCVEDGARGFGN